MITHQLEIKGNHFILYPQKGILWEEEKTLLVSDIHIGKTAKFRSMGIPVPGGTTTEDLQKLSELIKLTQVREVIILGDLLHSNIDNMEKTLNAFKLWRIENEAFEIYLVKGNHDKANNPFFDRLRINVISDHLERNNFVFAHHPIEIKDKFIFAGHIHPAIRLSGKGKMREQLQCFYFSDNFAILPSFGSFTGNFIIKPKDYEKIFVIAGDEVIEVNNN